VQREIVGYGMCIFSFIFTPYVKFPLGLSNGWVGPNSGSICPIRHNQNLFFQIQTRPFQITPSSYIKALVYMSTFSHMFCSFLVKCGCFHSIHVKLFSLFSLVFLFHVKLCSAWFSCTMVGFSFQYLMKCYYWDNLVLFSYQSTIVRFFFRAKSFN